LLEVFNALTIISLLVVISVLGIVYLSSSSSIWNWKVLTPVPEEVKRRPCNHSLAARRHLHGESYFQSYKHTNCTGGVIE
jgi:hypothetical protein